LKTIRQTTYTNSMNMYKQIKGLIPTGKTFLEKGTRKWWRRPLRYASCKLLKHDIANGYVKQENNESMKRKKCVTQILNVMKYTFNQARTIKGSS